MTRTYARSGKTIALGMLLCSLAMTAASGAEQARIPPYVSMGNDLAELRADFNDKAGSVRLLIIVGPTCGVCLLGLKSLDNELLAVNEDPDLHSFIVHVPALGAEEKDVEPAMALVTGKNVTHYWEDSGIIGALFQKALGRDDYVWDEWMIFAPEAKWSAELPPIPIYNVHILSEPEDFAARTRALLAAQ